LIPNTRDLRERQSLTSIFSRGSGTFRDLGSNYLEADASFRPSFH
jgi:hypothetical protein